MKTVAECAKAIKELQANGCQVLIEKRLTSLERLTAALVRIATESAPYAEQREKVQAIINEAEND